MMNGTTLQPKSEHKELPSIKNLFPALDVNSTAPRSQNVPENGFIVPMIGYPTAEVRLEAELNKFTQISSEIQQILDSSKSLRSVPRELLEAGNAQIDLLRSLYQSLLRTHDEEVARVPVFQRPSGGSSLQYTFQPAAPASAGVAPLPLLSSPSSFGNMEEQAARTLSSMIDISPTHRHQRTPSTEERSSTPPVSPSSFSVRKLKMKKSPSGGNNVTAQVLLEARVDNGNLAELLTNECLHCQSKETPEWRRGPEGERTLCNACGLFYAKLCKKYGEDKAKDIMKERKTKGSETDRRVSVGF
ncbi:hypothetical protein OGAPHI_007011 [Ogataea philodendri]|uniref:GATA-type domain-containing protein n=1 Tax=Ogataea philodendri TaxID=1378263 RepID=A0A9P8T016_9ASCO|nr:uncharacterized protein OGAPHI_007011 [Ogataea philodendri]KAH3660425.1 hypothetical protein OGAPHI_007011 [Ogataea philodendri]